MQFEPTRPDEAANRPTPDLSNQQARDPSPSLPGISSLYPHSRRGSDADMLHGTLVPDPYRWLEDLDSVETKNWIADQTALTTPYLKGLPARDAIESRLVELWSFERFGLPSEKGEKSFYFKNDGLQDHSVLYVADSASPTAPARPLLDPNALSPDGTVALAGTSISPDGKLLAYGLSRSGSDWSEWRVKDVATGRDLPEVVRHVKFSSVEWLPDSSAFIYGRFPEPAPGSEMLAANVGYTLYRHVLGSDQTFDTLVHERPDDPKLLFSPSISDDGRHLFIYTRHSSSINSVYVQDPASAGPATPLFAGLDGKYLVIGNEESKLYVLTTNGAAKGRVLEVDAGNPDPDNWKVLVAEGEHKIAAALIAGGKLVLTCTRDARDVIRVHSLDGAFETEIPLPGMGSVGGVSGRRESKDLYYSYSSFIQPATVYRYDIDSGTSTVHRGPVLEHDPSDYVETQVSYPSKDGTMVPMFVVHRKDIALDGSNPTLIYGYGGFNHSLPPAFSVLNLAWMERGGIYAQPSLRGGGELGEAWHEAGMKEKKQNVFDDFIAAAEHLIAAGYTRPSQLAIKGGSNGGLLVGACMTQRPDLFGACIPAVGVMDMLRFHKFTIGAAWIPEYGSPDVERDFRTLLAYSPLHNLRPGTDYPPTLVMTGDHDDRVVPSHSYKFAAALQHAQSGRHPCLIRIESEAGHGAGAPLSKTIEAAADQLAFLEAHLEGPVR